jgi:hypothetical protein
MAQMMTMAGVCVGNFDGAVLPAGYWLRPTEAPQAVPRLEFFDRVGATRFQAIFSAMVANPALAFTVFRGFAADTVEIGLSFPALLQMEQMGVLPAGSAIAVWS